MAAILATITLNASAGTSSGGVLTFSGFPKSDIADGTGTAAAARIRTAVGGTDIVTGLTVGTSASDINLDSVTITTGELITLTAATITHA
jgi:hypothetical protein